MNRLTKPARHVAHKVGTAHAHRKVKKLHKKGTFDAMLSPEFIVAERTTRQEIIAGVVAGLLLISFIVVTLVWGFPSIGSLFGTGNTPVKTVATAQPVIAQNNDLELKLQSWHLSGGGKDFKAYPGFRYVVVNVQIQHRHHLPTWLAPSLQSYVMDQSGQQYQLTPDDEITDPLPAKEYKVDEAATGGLAYEVPAGAKQLQWCYDLGRNTPDSAPLCVGLK